MRRMRMMLSAVPPAMAFALAVTILSPLPSVEAIPRPDGCTRIVTSGGAFIGHDCRRAVRVTRVTRVDPRLSSHFSRVSPRHERPIERLLSRGEGRIHAQGDKGGRQELREKATHHKRNRHNRR